MCVQEDQQDAYAALGLLPYLPVIVLASSMSCHARDITISSPATIVGDVLPMAMLIALPMAMPIALPFLPWLLPTLLRMSIVPLLQLLLRRTTTAMHIAIRQVTFSPLPG